MKLYLFRIETRGRDIVPHIVLPLASLIARDGSLPVFDAITNAERFGISINVS
jgi:hypothetical protein